jgi:hypothetical protein
MQSPNLKQLKYGVFMWNAAGILLYNIIYLLHAYFQIWLATIHVSRVVYKMFIHKL